MHGRGEKSEHVFVRHLTTGLDQGSVTDSGRAVHVGTHGLCLLLTPFIATHGGGDGL